MRGALLLLLGGCDALLRLQTVSVPDAPPRPDGLIAYYTFDDDQCATDVIGGHDGACANVAVRVAGPGKHGQAAMLDETSEIAVPHALELDPMTAYTIAAWVAPDHYDRDGVTYSCFVGKPYGPADGDTWQICGDATSTLFLFGGAIMYDAPIVTGAWTHIAMTWDGQTVIAWLGGVATDTMPSTQPASDARDLLLGADNDGAGLSNFFDGGIDEIQLYNRALSADEIAALAK